MLPYTVLLPLCKTHPTYLRRPNKHVILTSVLTRMTYGYRDMMKYLSR